MGTWLRNKKRDRSSYLKEQQQVGEKVSHKVTIGLSLYISKTNSQLAMPDQIMFKLCMRRMRLRGAGPPTVAWTVFGICHPSAALSRKIPNRVYLNEQKQFLLELNLAMYWFYKPNYY